MRTIPFQSAPRKLLESIGRALRNRRWEHSPLGIFIPAHNGLTIGGVFEHDLNGRDLQADHNLVVTEGMNSILSVCIANGTQIPTWYMAPFKGNYTPVAGLTAASFTSAATEATEYDEATRVQYQEGSAASGSIDNLSNKAAFTFNASIDVYGVALISVSTKSATTGTLLSATRFGSARSVIDDDVLNVGYTLTLSAA